MWWWPPCIHSNHPTRHSLMRHRRTWRKKCFKFNLCNSSKRSRKKIVKKYSGNCIIAFTFYGYCCTLQSTLHQASCYQRADGTLTFLKFRIWSKFLKCLMDMKSFLGVNGRSAISKSIWFHCARVTRRGLYWKPPQETALITTGQWSISEL